MQQFRAFVRKEFYHVFRDRKTLLMLFGLPIVQIVLFGFALTNEIKNNKIVVCDYSRDEKSRELTQQLAASPYFDLTENLLSISEVNQQFRETNVKVAVIIPAGFAQQLEHEKMVKIQVIADASDPNLATSLATYIQAIVLNNSAKEGTQAALPLRIDPQIRMLFNPVLKGATNFVPGVMSLVLLLVCVLMTSVSIVREKELGTMEVLLASPFHPFLVIISKAVPYLVLSMINLGVILLLSIYLLDMPVNGSLMLLIAESALFILTALSIGLLISNSTSSQQSAMLISLMGMMVPTMILTGFMFPLENMPLVLQGISHLVPSRWYFIIVKSIMIKGLGFSAIWKETLVLVGMTAFLLFLSFRKFKIRLA